MGRNLINLFYLRMYLALTRYSVIDCHHSFRPFRAQSLNLINVAVHTHQRLIRVGAVKIQRSRFGCAQNVERWQWVSENLIILQGNLANKIYKISRAAPLRVGAIISSSFVSIVIIYFLALRAEILLISFICACALLLSKCSAINYHHSFRSFRAQSLNLMNVAVHISKTNQRR